MWESLINLANIIAPCFAKLKQSKLVLTSYNLLADLFIHQPFLTKCSKRVNLPNFLPTKLFCYIYGIKLAISIIYICIHAYIQPKLLHAILTVTVKDQSVCSISESTPKCIGLSGGHPLICSKKLAINSKRIPVFGVGDIKYIVACHQSKDGTYACIGAWSTKYPFPL